MLEIDSSDCLEKKDLVQKIITSDSSSGPAKKKGGGSVNTRRAKISSLNCIVTENAEDDFDAVVIVCHGFGASENDLAPLAGQLLPAMRSHRVKMSFRKLQLSWDTGVTLGGLWICKRFAIFYNILSFSRRKRVALRCI